jgi:hypothetical protein
VVTLLLGAAGGLADFTINEGQRFSGPIESASCVPSSTTVTINWGDGTSSAGTYNSSTGEVSGTKPSPYAEEGTYTGTVALPGTGLAGGCPRGTTTDTFTANVPDASLSNASGTTVNATATQPFNGTVATFTDDDPGGTASDYAVTIEWGDGSSSAGSVSGPSNGKFSVNGSHTYATPGTYSIFATVTDQSTQGGSGGQSPSSTSAFTTANVGRPPPLFTECPPVGTNTGCQFLIVFTNSGKTIYEDPSQGPYENDDDALTGVLNQSSKPIAALPLSAPGLFNFEEDGICNPGSGPVAPGCRPAPGEPAGSTCGPQSDVCSFPAPPGEPFGYKEPGAIAPNRQNGYEGPTSWYSNVSRSRVTGHVNFSPHLQPGASTYFGLEEPPSASALIVGGPTKAYLPGPVLGKFFDVYPIKGVIYVRLPRGYPTAAADPGATEAITKGQGFVPLTEARQLPKGTQVDARAGTIRLVAAAAKGRKRQTGTFSGGVFSLAQDRRGKTKGLTTLSLLEGAFRGGPSFASCGRRASDTAGGGAQAARVSHKVLQALLATAKGKFRTRGRFAAATVRGTAWGLRDRCDGTLTVVRRGTVAVSDFVRHVTVLVHAHHTYFARRR